MKTNLLALFVCSFLFGSAEAAVRTKVQQLNTVTATQKDLKVSYIVGGGCQQHTAEVQLSPVYDIQNRLSVLMVDVYDVTPQADNCEALVGVMGDFDLKNLVEAKLKELNYQGNTIAVTLPSLRMNQLVF